MSMFGMDWDGDGNVSGEEDALTYSIFEDDFEGGSGGGGGYHNNNNSGGCCLFAFLFFCMLPGTLIFGVIEAIRLLV